MRIRGFREPQDQFWAACRPFFIRLLDPAAERIQSAVNAAEVLIVRVQDAQQRAGRYVFTQQYRLQTAERATPAGELLRTLPTFQVEGGKYRLASLQRLGGAPGVFRVDYQAVSGVTVPAGFTYRAETPEAPESAAQFTHVRVTFRKAGDKTGAASTIGTGRETGEFSLAVGGRATMLPVLMR